MTRATIVNDDGEITGYFEEGDRLLKGKSIEYLQVTDTWKMENFFKGNVGELRKQLQALSMTEKAFLFCMATYVGYDDCCLKYDNGNELSFDDMVTISAMSRSTVSQVITSLISKDIIYKGNNSQTRQYFVNPWLFCKGNRINKVLKTMFKNYKVKILGGIKWKDVR